MSNNGTLTEDVFNCGICFDILVDPTTLTCGHSICRFCLAQWWYKSKKNTCPECRQVWEGFPKVNVTLRNTIETLYPKEIKERISVFEKDKDYKEIKKKFESYGESKGTPGRSRLNWTWICILVAVTIAIAVVINVGIKKLFGSSPNDLMSKSIYDWSPDDVGLWIGSLGTWSKNKYDKRFVDAAIDGSLLLQVTENDLSAPPLLINMHLHRRIILDGISQLKKALPHHASGLWEYKERKSGMTTFIMFGLKEFPRSTLTYLYLFNYHDVFLPMFHGSLNSNANYTTMETMRKSSNPSFENWLEFIPKFICIPYYLVGTFSSRFLAIHYWTSRVVILHSILMTALEFTKSRYLFSGGIRQFPALALRYFVYVILTSLLFKIIWPFIPFFIADCIFYWLLYVSPFDALNRLRKVLSRRHENHRNNAQGGRHHHDHIHHHTIQHEGPGWHFNIRWNSERTE